MPVGIVGGRGSGKTVFVSLLAQSAIYFSNTTAGDAFRYYTEPAFTNVTGQIMAELKQQRWPPLTLKGNLSEFNFHFGYNRLFAGWTEGVLKKLPGHKVLPANLRYNIVRFNLYDIAGEDVEQVKYVAENARSRNSVLVDELPEDLRTILDCNVLVFLIDAKKISVDPSDSKYKEMLEYDNLMANLMSLVALYKSTKSKGKTTIYPIFVLTKFDGIDRKAMTSVGLKEDVGSWIRHLDETTRRVYDPAQKERNEYANRIMTKFFGHTEALKTGGRLKGINLDKGAFFFSFIRTEKGKDGFPIPKLVSPDRVSYELDYSTTEYEAFIRHFGKIAGKIRDKDEEPGQYITGLGR